MKLKLNKNQVKILGSYDVISGKKLKNKDVRELINMGMLNLWNADGPNPEASLSNKGRNIWGAIQFLKENDVIDQDNLSDN